MKQSKIFHNAHMADKENLFRYRRASKVNIYSLDGMEDYNYGYMAPAQAIWVFMTFTFMTRALSFKCRIWPIRYFRAIYAVA